MVLGSWFLVWKDNGVKTRYLVMALFLLLAAGAAGAAVKAPFDEAVLHVRIGGYWGMRLAARNSEWEPVLRAKPSFKHVDYGYVTKSSGTPERFKVSMQLWLDGGIRSPGHVFYDMEFQKQSDGTYKGTHKETHGANTGTGEVTAFLRPKQTYSKPGHVPIQPGEFPRLLMRKRDIPAIRAKAKTPFGEAFLAKAKGAKDPVVLGMLYQATGDAAYATEALRIVSHYGDIDSNGALTGDVGHQIVRVALAFDLCYDAWPKDYRDGLLQQIKARLPKRQYDLTIGHANYNQVSNYYGPGFGSAAIASLLLYGQRGPAPTPPDKPLCVRYPDCRLPPLTDYQPPEGVPVVPLVNDTLPKDWIYCGGFKPPDGMDMLAPLGGAEKARPSLEDNLTDGTKTQSFKPVSHEKDKGYFFWGNRDVLDVTMAIDRIYHSESYFYTVVKNDTPGWYEFQVGLDHKDSWTYLNGILVEPGTVLQLDKGLYTILTKVRIGQTEPWGREMLATRFTLLKNKKKKDKTVDEINADIRARYDQAVAFHKTEMAEWKARDGEDLECLRMFHKARCQMFWNYRFGIGDGGFTAEVTHYGVIAERYPMLYAALYRNAFGEDVSTYPDATHLLPRQMMQACFRGSKPAIMNLNVKAHFDHATCADHFPLVPDEWKPYLLWGWNRISDITIDSTSKLDRAAADKLFAPVNGNRLATTYINYPLDRDPVHPSKGMPLTWKADTLGFYVFRSGWEGKDEFVTQVFSKSIPIRAWSHPNCGALRIFGLGKRWTSAPIERSGYRPEESIVLMPDDVTNESACGKIADYTALPDGSGSLLIDMQDVYLAARPPETKKKTDDQKLLDDLESTLADKDLDADFGLRDSIKDMPVTKSVTDYFREKDRAALRSRIPKLYSWWGERFPDVDMTSHVNGSRSFAFDYSGKSGAPFLMALSDSIQGGKKKQWIWHLPAGDDVFGEGKDNWFEVRYPDAKLRGTIISPSPIRARFMRNQKMHFIYRGGSKKGQVISRDFNFIAAETTAKDVDFVVVITIQRGDAPPVAVTGKGKDAVARIGERTVRFDGKKVVIE